MDSQRELVSWDLKKWANSVKHEPQMENTSFEKYQVTRGLEAMNNVLTHASDKKNAFNKASKDLLTAIQEKPQQEINYSVCKLKNLQ